MISYLYSKLSDPQFMFGLMVAIAAAATVLTLAMPFLEADGLQKRMKVVGSEREKIRAREREKLAKGMDQRAGLRQTPKAYMKQVVDQLKLGEWLGTETPRRRS